MLPKIIHYCWFGGSDLPEDYKKIIAEWKLLHPEWTIKRWDESNAPMSVPYIQKAVELNNWANVSNYVRIYALLAEGGIYLDTDMKLLKPLDSLLSHNCFLGFESGGDDVPVFWLNNAIMGAIPSHHFLIACEDKLLTQFDGTEKSNLSSPHLVTNLLKEQYGLEKYGRQMIQDIVIFEKEIFYPVPYDKVYLFKQGITFPDETIAVHMWGRTWFDQTMMLNIIDELQYNVDEGKSHAIKVAKELDQIRDENNYLKGILTNYKSLESNINQLFTEVNSKIDQLDSKIDQLDSKIDQFSSKIDQVNLNFEQTINTTKKQQSIIEQELTSLHQKLDNCNNTITKQQEIINQYKKAYDESSIWQIAKRRFLKK
jgi:hypothetical protein